MAKRRRFNREQARESAKYFLDVSKYSFTILVLGLLVAQGRLALRSVLWYIGIIFATVSYLVAMRFLKTRR